MCRLCRFLWASGKHLTLSQPEYSHALIARTFICIGAFYCEGDGLGKTGTERSRRSCLELVCADFLAGRGEESLPEEILMVIHRLVRLLPRDYQEGIAGGGGRELEAAGKC